MPVRGAGQLPESVVVHAGVNRAGAYISGCFIVLWTVLLLAIEAIGLPTSRDRIVVAVIFGVLLLISVSGWLANRRARGQLEIRRIDIISRPAVYNRGQGRRPRRVNRLDGDLLRILPEVKLYGKISPPRLVFLGRGEFIVLKQPHEGPFPLAEIQQACEALGWPFGGDSSLAARDVQAWRRCGQSLEAMQLLDLFGPFPGVAADGNPHVALSAAVFEDVGDSLVTSNKADARDAYARAVRAQRAFAGDARSAGVHAVRLAEASRIEAKAHA